MGELFRRLYYLINRQRLDAELQNDIEFHREMAARAGNRNFGNTLRMREQAYEAWGWTWLDRLVQDLRFGMRILGRSPGFTLAAVLVLAIGVGVNVSRHEIEEGFVGWQSPAVMAREYGVADRASIYRHAHALGLFPKRQHNVRAALERIIEKAGEVEVTASAVVAAIQAYSKINADGRWVDRSEQVNLNDLFDRMTSQELEEYAQHGVLPRWFEAAGMSATAPDGPA
jgi:hypothetical protein